MDIAVVSVGNHRHMFVIITHTFVNVTANLEENPDKLFVGISHELYKPVRDHTKPNV